VVAQAYPAAPPSAAHHDAAQQVAPCVDRRRIDRLADEFNQPAARLPRCRRCVEGFLWQDAHAPLRA
jgi:hypothetical protein